MDDHGAELMLGRLHSLEVYAYAGWVGACLTTLLALFLLSRSSSQSAPAGLNPSTKGERSQSHNLHECDRASASLEFLLVFFPLLAIVLAVWQLAFMINAQLSVGYSAYAAGRSASTVAYMDLPEEDIGILIGIDANGNDNSTRKWTRINRAAIPGVIAISPGTAEKAALAYASAQVGQAISNNALPNLPNIDLTAVPGRFTLMTAHREDAILQGKRMQRLAVKSTYATASTNVLINGSDQSAATLNLGTAETIDVTVEYDFWLNVPYAGRMMKVAFGGPISNLLPIPGQFQPTLRMSETVTVRAWPKLKAF